MTRQFAEWVARNRVAWIIPTDPDTKIFDTCEATGLWSDVYECECEDEDGFIWTADLNVYDVVTWIMNEEAVA